MWSCRWCSCSLGTGILCPRGLGGVVSSHSCVCVLPFRGVARCLRQMDPAPDILHHHRSGPADPHRRRAVVRRIPPVPHVGVCRVFGHGSAAGATGVCQAHVTPAAAPVRVHFQARRVLCVWQRAVSGPQRCPGMRLCMRMRACACVRACVLACLLCDVVWCHFMTPVCFATSASRAAHLVSQNIQRIIASLDGPLAALNMVQEVCVGGWMVVGAHVPGSRFTSHRVTHPSPTQRNGVWPVQKGHITNIAGRRVLLAINTLVERYGVFHASLELFLSDAQRVGHAGQLALFVAAMGSWLEQGSIDGASLCMHDVQYWVACPTLCASMRRCHPATTHQSNLLSLPTLSSKLVRCSSPHGVPFLPLLALLPLPRRNGGAVPGQPCS